MGIAASSKAGQVQVTLARAGAGEPGSKRQREQEPEQDLHAQARDPQFLEQIAEGKKTAPTRPHPHPPLSPGALKTAGPIAAVADKARELWRSICRRQGRR